MTQFIDLLSELDEQKLTRMLGYYTYGDGFRRGEEIYHSEGYKIYHSWNHDHSSSKDYDDTYLCISDYDVKCYYNRQERLKTLFSFMYDKFGDEWANKAVKYLTGKKAKHSTQYVQSLINQSKTENENDLSK